MIDTRVPLKKSGSNYSACCPFHSEKTPSFSVNRTKQFYHCFGCGAHGNAITFLIEFERLSFPEAVESLASNLGLDVPYEGATEERGHASTSIAHLYELQNQIAKFYAKQFKQHPDGGSAVDYLKARGVSGDVAKTYLLGFAPPDWRNIPDVYSIDDLEACGLVIRNDRARYDRFRNRVMFPIRDYRGRVVGFGGRIMGEGSPKYLNSPETPTFKKNKEVYGLYELLQCIRKPERILVVEGYMDVIALVQHGVRYAVATLGTATSEEHISLLFRYTDEVVFCFDGDAAGQAAAWKALVVTLSSLKDGKQAKFMELPTKQDPDSLVRQEGGGNFEQRIANCDSCSEYFFRRLTEGRNLTSIEEKAAIASQAKPLLARIPKGNFSLMMHNRLNELVGHVSSPQRFASKRINSAGKSESTGNRPSSRKFLIAMILQYPRLGRLLDTDTRAQLSGLSSLNAILERVLELTDSHPEITSGAILEHFRGSDIEPKLASLSLWDSAITDEEAEQIFVDTLGRVKQRLLDQRIDKLLELARSNQLEPKDRDELAFLLRKKSNPSSA